VEEFGRAFALALTLLGALDRELIGIVGLSLRVSLSATLLAFCLGAPLGAMLAVYRLPGRQVWLVAVNALLGLPPVVVGLAVYVLLSRAGPLGALGLLFTPGAMIAAQTVLATPIVIALVHRSGAPRHLPDAQQFQAGAKDLEARYESAWLACRLLARDGGPGALVGFYRAMDRGGELRPELQRWFGLTPAAFTEQWRTLLSHLPA